MSPSYHVITDRVAWRHRPLARLLSLAEKSDHECASDVCFFCGEDYCAVCGHVC